jgi:hypothetical protein
MSSEEVDQFEDKGGVRAIPFNLGKSSNVETFDRRTSCDSKEMASIVLQLAHPSS